MTWSGCWSRTTTSSWWKGMATTHPPSPSAPSLTTCTTWIPSSTQVGSASKTAWRLRLNCSTYLPKYLALILKRAWGHFWDIISLCRIGQQENRCCFAQRGSLSGVGDNEDQEGQPPRKPHPQVSPEEGFPHDGQDCGQPGRIEEFMQLCLVQFLGEVHIAQKWIQSGLPALIYFVTRTILSSRGQQLQFFRMLLYCYWNHWASEITV